MIVLFILLVFLAFLVAGAFAGWHDHWLRRIAIGTGIAALVLGWAITAVGCGPLYLLSFHDTGRCEDGSVVLIIAAMLVIVVLAAALLGLLIGWLLRKISP